MQETGCSVVALETPAGLQINPPASEQMREGERILLICTPEAEQRFLERYGTRLSGAKG
jgi:hypothetical protein